MYQVISIGIPNGAKTTWMMSKSFPTRQLPDEKELQTKFHYYNKVRYSLETLVQGM